MVNSTLNDSDVLVMLTAFEVGTWIDARSMFGGRTHWKCEAILVKPARHGTERTYEEHGEYYGDEDEEEREETT